MILALSLSILNVGFTFRNLSGFLAKNRRITFSAISD